jgi:pSer/pThr/pTyr-binding forkhead associated (FHA) protein
LLVGRSTDCDIQITGDPAISRHHARLEVAEDDSITISRLSATNPVIIGGVQVGNHHPLRPNDVIHLSDATRLIYIEKPDSDA